MIVKELLLKQNIEELISYMKKHFIFEYDDREFKEKRFEKGFPLTFKDIEKVEPIKNNEDYIFGYTCLDLDDDLNPEEIPAFYCFEKEEIKEKTFEEEINSFEDVLKLKIPISYGLIFLDWEEILGYNIIPYFEQVSELELAAQLLWELTWAGYTKETYDKNSKIESDKLDRRSKEAKKALEEGNQDYFVSWDDIKEEMFEEMYSDLTEEEKEEKRRQQEIHQQEFIKKSRELSIDNTRNILEGFKVVKEYL